MFSHIVVGVSDFDRALRFYEPLFAVLGVSRRFCEPGVPWAGWHSGEGARPFFVIARPFDGAVHVAGNGQMTAFLAESREQVRQAHAAALRAGGACEGTPGLAAAISCGLLRRVFPRSRRQQALRGVSPPPAMS